MTPPQPDIREKRRWPRYAVDIPAVIARPSIRRVEAHATELNEGGITVYAKADFQINDHLQVELMPPFYNTAIRLPVLVKCRDASRYGMEFVGNSDADRQELALLCVLVRKLEVRASHHSDPST